MAFSLSDPSTWDSSALGQLGALGLGAALGSSSGSQAGTSTTTNEPWSVQQPYLADLFSSAKNLYGQTKGVSGDMADAFRGMQGAVGNDLSGKAQSAISSTLGIDPSSYFGIGRANPYQGQTTQQVVNPYANAQAAQAQAPALVKAVQANNPYANAQASVIQASQAINPYLGVDNPYLRQSIDSASQSAMRNLMPAYNQAQNASGSFGNSGVADYFGRAAADTLGNIANNAYMNQYNTSQQLAGQQSQYNATNQQNAALANQNAVNSMNQAAMSGTAGINTYNAGAQNSINSANQQLAQQNNQYNATNLQNQNQYNAGLASSLGFGNAQLQANDLSRNSNLAQTGIANDISQYNQGQNVLNNAAFNAPGFNTSNLNNYGTLYNAASLNNAAQWNPLNSYSNLVRGSYGSTSTSPYYTNNAAGALGGALLGSQVYSNLFGGKSGA